MAGFLVPLLKGAASAFAGGAINRFFNNAQQRDSYGFLASQGLTPQEIAGSGAAGQGSSGVGNVLGNTAAALEQQQRQIDFQVSERAKDRQLQERAQDMGLLSTQISSGAAYEANALKARELDEVTIPRAEQDLITTSPEFRLRQLQMQMGPDNFFVEAISKRFGISLTNDTVANMSQGEWSSFVREIHLFQSQVMREAAGASETLGQGGEGYLGGLKSLGRGLQSVNPIQPLFDALSRESGPASGDRGRPTGRGY